MGRVVELRFKVYQHLATTTSYSSLQIEYGKLLGILLLLPGSGIVLLLLLHSDLALELPKMPRARTPARPLGPHASHT